MNGNGTVLMPAVVMDRKFSAPEHDLDYVLDRRDALTAMLEALPPKHEEAVRFFYFTDLAQEDNGTPKEPFYLAGNVGGKPVSVYSEGERLVMKQGNDEAKEVELVSPKAQEGAALPEHVCPAGVVGEESTATPGYEEPPAPGTSPLDAGLEALSKTLGNAPDDAASTEQDGGVR